MVDGGSGSFFSESRTLEARLLIVFGVAFPVFKAFPALLARSFVGFFLSVMRTPPRKLPVKVCRSPDQFDFITLAFFDNHLK